MCTCMSNSRRCVGWLGWLVVGWVSIVQLWSTFIPPNNLRLPTLTKAVLKQMGENHIYAGVTLFKMIRERHKYMLRNNKSGHTTHSDTATETDALLYMLDETHLEEWQRREENKTHL